MPRNGRKPKLTPAIQQKIVDAIKAGNYYEPACIYAGITYQTFRNWMIWGEAKGSGLYFDFFEAITRAEAQAEVSVVANWMKAIPEDWRAARDFLDRRYNERWRRVEVSEMSGIAGGPIQIENVTGITDDERADRIAGVLERAGKRLAGPAPTTGPYLGPSNGSTNGSVAH